MLGMHPPFFQGVLVPLNMTNPVRFMTNPCLTNPLFKNKMTKFLSLYRLSHGFSFVVMSDLFGVSKCLAINIFNYVVTELVVHLYYDYV